jgi:hypothetical protein
LHQQPGEGRGFHGSKMAKQSLQPASVLILLKSAEMNQ